MKNNQNGGANRKTIVIIALLCAGILWGFNKVKDHNQIANLKSEISSLGKTVSKQHDHIAEITNKYSTNYLLFLRNTGNLPSNMPYANDAVQASYGAKIKAFTDDYGVVILEVANIDKKACIELATNNWGNLRTAQFAGIGIGVVPNFSCLAQNSSKFDYVSTFPGTIDYPFSEERASYPCSLFKGSRSAKVYLGYKLQ